MKQLDNDTRNRLALNPDVKDVLSQPDLTDTAEAQETDEDGRQGSPGYLAQRVSQEPSDEESSNEEGKGNQIDFEV